MRKTGLYFLWISVVILALDWFSKSMIQQHLQLYQTISVAPFINLTLAYNTGAAFSFLDTGSFWPNVLFGVVAVVVSVIILIWMSRLKRQEKLMAIALACILGGAIGNLWDRVRYQRVTDFIDLYVADWHWPVFNVADMAVCLGALLIVYQWMKAKN